MAAAAAACLENLFPRFAMSRRWTLSFLFGLMHGFGFSSVLREIGLPREGLLLLALLNFNLGVEAGQLVAVAVVVPLLIWPLAGSKVLPSKFPQDSLQIPRQFAHELAPLAR